MQWFSLFLLFFSSFFPEFKGYIIVNFSEIRSQLKELTRQIAILGARPFGNSRAQQNLASDPAEEGGEFMEEDDDPLAGLPAMTLDVWLDFDLQLTNNKKFRQTVVRLSILFNAFNAFRYHAGCAIAFCL